MKLVKRKRNYNGQNLIQYALCAFGMETPYPVIRLSLSRVSLNPKTPNPRPVNR